MQEIETQLQELDLSPEETRIYVTLLRLGAQSVSSIARQTTLPRVNCYHYIEKLVEKGYISRTQHEKVAHFVAENPRVIVNRQIERVNIARDTLPQLLALQAASGIRPRIQVFEGKESVKNIFNRMLTIAQGEIVSFSNFDALDACLPDFLTQHFAARASAGIKSRFITPHTPTASKFRKKYFPKTMDPRLLEIFYIATAEFRFPSEISIFTNSIAVVTLSKEHTLAVLIENQALYETQKAIFDLAWLGATSFITQ